MDENLRKLQVFSSLSLEKIFSSQREEFYLKNVRALVEAASMSVAAMRTIVLQQ